MGTFTIERRVTEIRRRISQIDATSALNAFNKAAEWITMQGSFVFDCVGTANFTSVASAALDNPEESFAQVTMPDDWDEKKLLFVSNSTGLPVTKVPVHRLWESFALNNSVDMGFSTYSIFGRVLLLRPGQSTAVSVGCRYHVKILPMGLEDTSRLPDVLETMAVDLAEADERRIYDVGEQWVKQLDGTKAAIMKMLDGYRTPTEEPMPMEEAVASVQEQTKLGRA